ncbi:hypothetical protein CNMCM6457_003032 [Aspergillus fumigatiaffinis]|nr:hypothetical protein CNMCM6457_003032 [Aspergillus fumigatiaffinis]
MGLYLLLSLLLSFTLAKANALTDLSNGFCRSYQFGANIVNDTLYLIDLDGGLLPGDGNSSHNYLVHLDLTQPFSINDGSDYHLSLIDPTVPQLKGQTLWSNAANTTLYSYGGHGLGNTSIDEGIWTYDLAGEKWAVQRTSIKPVRLYSGASSNVPHLQSSFWAGGYQDRDTTPAITHQRRVAAPFTPVQNGALVYVPVGEGVLVYMGGETPSVADGVNATMAPNSWAYVFVYDIAEDRWYNQTTTGTIASRTEFCAVVQHDPSSSTYEVYVLGGADYESKEVLSDVSYLSLPSFHWYKAAELEQQRMTLVCEAYGPQVFGIGGRIHWADDQDAGCYTMPAFIYDVNSGSSRAKFDPALTSYSQPSAVAERTKVSPYPATWADPSLRELFVPTETSSSTASASETEHSHGMPVGAIVGGVIGGVAVIIIIVIGVILVRRKKSSPNDTTEKRSFTYTSGTGEYIPVDDVEKLERYRPGGYHPITIGAWLNDRYRIVHKLGFGTYSTVWLARDQQTKNYVAIKITVAAGDPADSQESNILRQLGVAGLKTESHAGATYIPRILDKFSISGPNGIHWCFVSAPGMMSLVEAKDASSVRLFQLPVARAIAAQLVQAVAFLHSQGIVHGDLHAGNILLRLPESMNTLSPEKLYEQCGQTHTEPVERLDQRSIPDGVPSHAVVPVWLGKASERISPSEAQIIVTDYGESFMPASTMRDRSHAPALLTPPEVHFEPQEPRSLFVDTWTLECTIWAVISQRPLLEGFNPSPDWDDQRTG